MTKKEDLENLVAEISKKEKYINVLVCNAGISGPKAEPKSESATELKDTLFNGESFGEWSDTFKTNVSGVYVSRRHPFAMRCDGTCNNRNSSLLWPFYHSSKQARNPMVIYLPL